MTDKITSVLVLAVALIAVMMLLFALRRRREEAPVARLVSGARRLSWPVRIVIGTDADLKVEFAYVLYTLFAVTVSKAIYGNRPAPKLLWLLVIVSMIQGFHFRQWLSKWRYRNIIYARILNQERPFYTRGPEEMTAFVLNNLVFWALLLTAGSYAIPQIGGFLLHEVASESKKRLLLVKRKLHLFDLDFISDDNMKVSLTTAVVQFRLGVIEKIARHSENIEQRVLLTAFVAWMRNNHSGFLAILKEHRSLVEDNPKLAYYFGKALYALGDVDDAEYLLTRGCSTVNDKMCLAYLALCSLARKRDPASVLAVEERLRPVLNRHGETKADMFAAAYYALAMGIATADDNRDERLREALFYIHEAMRINQEIYNRGDLKAIRREYFEANNQIFLDIYGYIVYRQDNVQLSFRVLESALASDNTYPWPYFHIALLYDRVGRTDRARAIYFRIAVNETAETVLKLLCERRLAAVREPV